jgi:hypothetical protein
VVVRLDDESAWRTAIETTLQDLATRKGPDAASCASYGHSSQAVAALPQP